MQTISVVACALIDEDEILIVRRGPDQSGAGEWEFPGGKIENGEAQIEALQREIHEELSIGIEVGTLLAENRHQFSSKEIHLYLYQCSFQMGFKRSDIVLSEHDGQEWILISELQAKKLSLPDQPFVPVLQKLFI